MWWVLYCNLFLYSVFSRYILHSSDGIWMHEYNVTSCKISVMWLAEFCAGLGWLWSWKRMNWVSAMHICSQHLSIYGLQVTPLVRPRAFSIGHGEYTLQSLYYRWYLAWLHLCSHDPKPRLIHLVSFYWRVYHLSESEMIPWRSYLNFLYAWHFFEYFHRLVTKCHTLYKFLCIVQTFWF